MTATVCRDILRGGPWAVRGAGPSGPADTDGAPRGPGKDALDLIFLSISGGSSLHFLGLSGCETPDIQPVLAQCAAHVGSRWAHGKESGHQQGLLDEVAFELSKTSLSFLSRNEG